MPKALPLILEKTISGVNIFLGGLGSGKTTVALNVALFSAARILSKKATTEGSRERIFLVDLDVINPYFRSRMVQPEMAAHGVEVISPPASIAQGDLPALPAAIRGALDSGAGLVFDIGGDTVGATALGCYQPYILKREYRLFFVVNTRRPFTDTAEKIRAAVGEIEDAARLKVHFLVNNTNIGQATGVEELKEGLAIVQQAGELLKIPVAFNAVLEERNVPEMRELAGEVLLLKRVFRLPWE